MGERAKLSLNEYLAKDLLNRDDLDLDKMYSSDLKILITTAIKEIARLNNIIDELDNMFYESFRINKNGSYTITETDYKEIENKLQELKGEDKE